MTDKKIKPLKVGYDWLCWDECPQATDKSYSHCLCEIDGEYRRHANDGIGDVAPHLCPHQYKRMAAWAEEARSLLNLARIAIEQYGDKTGMLAANMRTLDDAYPGKDGER